jgi:uncharacterized protein
MNYNFAIYHKNCPDGFSSLMILLKSKRLSRDGIIYHDVPYATHPPKGIDNKDIIIMDVAYKLEVLRQILERAKSVVFIDHHVTIKDDVEKLSQIPKYKNKIKIIYDVKESGASLTWDYLFKNKRMPLFIRYIKDNDIGAWKLRDTKPFSYGLRVKYDLDLKRDVVEKWKELFKDKNAKKLIKIGRIYEEYADLLLEENAKKYSLEAFPSQNIYMEHTDHFDKPGQYKVAVTSSACPNASLLGNMMMDTIKCDFVIIYSYQMERKEYTLQFRSKHVDVGKIAKIFGGGGHKLASACSFPASKYRIDDLFFPHSLPRR